MVVYRARVQAAEGLVSELERRHVARVHGAARRLAWCNRRGLGDEWIAHWLTTTIRDGRQHLDEAAIADAVARGLKEGRSCA